MDFANHCETSRAANQRSAQTKTLPVPGRVVQVSRVILGGGGSEQSGLAQIAPHACICYYTVCALFMHECLCKHDAHTKYTNIFVHVPPHPQIGFPNLL